MATVRNLPVDFPLAVGSWKMKENDDQRNSNQTKKFNFPPLIPLARVRDRKNESARV
ncbi:MAG: hypothetical protein ACFFD4_37110 [Candidatus Odinarchaeota archaeon]